MRDPQRIDKILLTVGKIWKDHPDLRLGQLIANVVSESYIYFIEDDELLKALEDLYLKQDIKAKHIMSSKQKALKKWLNEELKKINKQNKKTKKKVK